jgi:hypothetical protein
MQENLGASTAGTFLLDCGEPVADAPGIHLLHRTLLEPRSPGP